MLSTWEGVGGGGEGRNLRHVVTLPPSAAAINEVLTACGKPLTDPRDAEMAAINPDAIVRSSDQFTLLQGGGFDAGLLSFMEVSGAGDVNVSLLKSRPHATAGIGGFADITGFAPHLVFSGQFTAGRKDVTLGEGRLQINSLDETLSLSPQGRLSVNTADDRPWSTPFCIAIAWSMVL